MVWFSLKPVNTLTSHSCRCEGAWVSTLSLRFHSTPVYLCRCRHPDRYLALPRVWRPPAVALVDLQHATHTVTSHQWPLWLVVAVIFCKKIILGGSSASSQIMADCAVHLLLNLSVSVYPLLSSVHLPYLLRCCWTQCDSAGRSVAPQHQSDYHFQLYMPIWQCISPRLHLTYYTASSSLRDVYRGR